MAIYLEKLNLEKDFPFQILVNEGDILTTPHWHKEVEILYIQSGVVNLGVCDKPITAKAGDIILIAGGESHYVLASGDSERLVFQFDLNFFKEISSLKNTALTLGEMIASRSFCSQDWDDNVRRKAADLLLSAYEEYKGQRQGYSYAVKGYLSLLLAVLYQDVPELSAKERNRMKLSGNRTLEKLDGIFRYVEDNYQKDIQLEDVAGHVGFDVFYFTKFFKKNTDKTFFAFLNEYRVEKAKWILLNEDVPIAELVERSGFGSSKTFYRVFKQATGLSPTQYQKQNL